MTANVNVKFEAMKREEIKDILDSFWYGRIGRDEATDKLLNLHLVSQRELLNALSDSIYKEFQTYAYLPDLIEHIKSFNCG